jgi:hypothetical protein
MTRGQQVLLAGIGLVLVLVVVLALRTRRPPFLPADADHDTATPVETCLACHGPGGPKPRSPNHPVQRDCLHCHGVR